VSDLRNRRTSRLQLSIPVEISYTDRNGEPRLERTHTLVIDRHGARIATRAFHQTGAMMHVAIPHLGRSAHCRVVWCSAPANGIFEVGVEMDADANIWGVHFELNEPDETAPSSDLELLVEMLVERGVLRRGEFEARRAKLPVASGMSYRS
jgi:hypothetical protein